MACGLSNLMSNFCQVILNLYVGLNTSETLSQGFDVNWGFALFLPSVARFFVSFLAINFFIM